MSKPNTPPGKQTPNGYGRLYTFFKDIEGHVDGFQAQVKTLYKPLSAPKTLQRAAAVAMPDSLQIDHVSVMRFLENISYRYLVLDVLIYEAEKPIYEAYLENADFRYQAITKGMKVFKRKGGEKPVYYYAPYLHHNYPSTAQPGDYPLGPKAYPLAGNCNDDEAEASAEFENNPNYEVVLNWLGCGMVIPKKKLTTSVNKETLRPYISFNGEVLDSSNKNIVVYALGDGLDAYVSRGALMEDTAEGDRNLAYDAITFLCAGGALNSTAGEERNILVILEDDFFKTSPSIHIELPLVKEPPGKLASVNIDEEDENMATGLTFCL